MQQMLTRASQHLLHNKIVALQIEQKTKRRCRKFFKNQAALTN